MMRPLETICSSRGTLALWALVALLIAGWFCALRVVDDYGISWDESVQAEYAEQVWSYFATGGDDRSCNGYLDLKYYGPTADLAAAAAYRHLPHEKFTIRHLTSALFGLLTIIPLYGLARLSGRPWLGVLAGAALLLLPRYVGHAFVNSKDIPFACLFAWSMWAMTAYFLADPRGWRHVLACSTCLGLLAAVRPGGWILMTILFAVLMVFADFLQKRRQRVGKQAGPQLAALLVLAWLVMVSLWPWAHENIIYHPIEAMQMASNFHLRIPVLFEGQETISTELPRYYLPKYLLMTVPTFLIGLAVIGFGWSLNRQWRDRFGNEACVLFALQIWLFLPLALYVVKQPNVYDGMRHFLFLLPCVAMWAALGVAALWEGWPSRQGRIATGLVLSLLAVGSGRDIVRLHPYQMTYFNRAVGGLAGADGWYETDYWVTSYREAMEWIVQRTDARRPIRVLVAANGHSRMCAEFYCPRHIEVDIVESFGHQGSLPAGYAYYVATYRSGMNHNFPDSPIVKTIGREGAVFTIIRQADNAGNLGPDLVRAN